MGWLWWASPTSTESNSPKSNDSKASLATQDNPRLLDDVSTNPTPSAPAQIAKHEMSRDEQAAAELAQFIAEFEAEAARERAAASKNQGSSTETQGNIASRFASRFASRSSPTQGASGRADSSEISLQSSHDPSDVSFTALADEELSCRAAFDYAFFCQSMGGQWTNVYRYGELRSCSHLWKEFWLCMRAKSYPEEERRKIVKQHNIEKLKKWRTGPSSEDIWDVRDKLDLNEPEPFKGDFVKLEKEIEEWKKRTGNSNVSI